MISLLPLAGQIRSAVTPTYSASDWRSVRASRSGYRFISPATPATAAVIAATTSGGGGTGSR